MGEIRPLSHLRPRRKKREKLAGQPKGAHSCALRLSAHAPRAVDLEVALLAERRARGRDGQRMRFASDRCSRDQLRGRMAMLALRSHVAEAAGASSSWSSRAPPSLGQDRSAPPSGAQRRLRRARGRRATRQGLLLADFSRARRPAAAGLGALGPAGATRSRFFSGERLPLQVTVVTWGSI